MDMMDTVIPKSDQLNADDLIGGKTMTIKITNTSVKKGLMSNPPRSTSRAITGSLISHASPCGES